MKSNDQNNCPLFFFIYCLKLIYSNNHKISMLIFTLVIYVIYILPLLRSSKCKAFIFLNDDAISKFSLKFAHAKPTIFPLFFQKLRLHDSFDMSSTRILFFMICSLKHLKIYILGTPSYYNDLI